MNIHQLHFSLAALILLLVYTRYVDGELDWVEFCNNATVPTVGGSSGNENNGNGNGNNGNGNGNNGNGNGNNGNGNGNNGNGNGNNGNGNGNNGNGNGNNGNGNGNNGNGNGNNVDTTPTPSTGAVIDTYMETICNARIASFVTSCTGTHSTFTLESAVPNTGQLVLEKTAVTNLDCTHLCELLTECVFFTYETSTTLCQIYIVGSNTPSESVVWRKGV